MMMMMMMRRRREEEEEMQQQYKKIFKYKCVSNLPNPFKMHDVCEAESALHVTFQKYTT